MHTNKRIADIHASIGNDMLDLNGISKVFKGGNLTGATSIDLGKTLTISSPLALATAFSTTSARFKCSHPCTAK